MKILVIGANGKVGKLLIKWLVKEKYSVRAMVRSEAQQNNMIELGAEPFVADLEDDFSTAYNGCEAVAFSAGSGSKTGPEKTIDVDQNAAIRSMDIAIEKGIKHYCMVSAQGVRSPNDPSPIQHYYKAKAAADNYLINNKLNYTIYRPGRLTDEPFNGKGEMGIDLQRGFTSRDNLAYVIAKNIGNEEVYRKIFEVVDGERKL